MHEDETHCAPRWSTKEVSNLANISEPTVRKYAQILTRECDYHFQTINGKGTRRFSDHDITLFREMKRLSDESGMEVLHIAKMVVARYGTGVSDATLDVSVSDTALRPYPTDFHAIVEDASARFWQGAKKQLLEEVREVIRDEVRTEMDDLKYQVKELTEATRQIATTADKRKKRWWKA